MKRAGLGGAPRRGSTLPRYVAASQLRAERRRTPMLGDGPWRRGDRSIAVGGCGLGLAGIAICGYQSRGEVEFSDQLGWLLGGILCVSLSSVSLAYWLMSGWRTVRLEVAGVLTTIVPNAPAAATHSGTGFVTAAGMVRYHRPGCPLVAGKTVRQVGVDELKPCGACEADV